MVRCGGAASRTGPLSTWLRSRPWWRDEWGRGRTATVSLEMWAVLSDDLKLGTQSMWFSLCQKCLALMYVLIGAWKLVSIVNIQHMTESIFNRCCTVQYCMCHGGEGQCETGQASFIPASLLAIIWKLFRHNRIFNPWQTVTPPAGNGRVSCNCCGCPLLLMACVAPEIQHENRRFKTESLRCDFSEISWISYVVICWHADWDVGIFLYAWSCHRDNSSVSEFEQLCFIHPSSLSHPLCTWLQGAGVNPGKHSARTRLHSDTLAVYPHTRNRYVAWTQGLLWLSSKSLVSDLVHCSNTTTRLKHSEMSKIMLCTVRGCFWVACMKV